MRRTQYTTMVALVLLLAGLILGASVVSSQSETNACPEIVTLAIDSTGMFCEDTTRNQICYGHILVEALPQAGAQGFAFTDMGDRVDLLDVRSLTLTPLDEATQEWGISLMRLQANLPSAATGQYATLLAFGDVQLDNEAEALPMLEVTANTYANVRRLPSADDFVLTSLAPAQTLVADGRLADSSWVRVMLPEMGETGWISASLVSTQEPLESLAVVTAGSTHYNPFQAFFLRTGVADAGCAEAPQSGIMIQTPEGVAEVRLLINEIAIRLGSTAFIQAVPGEDLTFNLLEGSALVEAAGVTQRVFPGTRVHVPLAEDGTAAASPSIPEPYEMDVLAPLPLTLLDREIEIAPALTWPQIYALLGQGEDEGDEGDGENVVAITHASFNPGNRQVLLHATYNGSVDPEVTLTAVPGGEMEILGDHYQLAFTLENACPATITVTASTGETASVVVCEEGETGGGGGEDGGNGGGEHVGVVIIHASYSAGNGQVLLKATYNGGVDPNVTLTASPGGVMEILGDHYQLSFRPSGGCPCTIVVTASTGESASVTVGG